MNAAISPDLVSSLLKWAGLLSIFIGLLIGSWAAVADTQGPVMRYCCLLYTSPSPRD